MGDDVLFKLQDKSLRNLTRLVMSAFDMIQLPDLSLQFEGGLPEEISAELAAQKRLLKCFAIYTLALHSDSVQKGKLTSLTALGMTEHEVLALNSFLI